MIERAPGPIVDGRPYADADLMRALEEYHVSAAAAHRAHGDVPIALPELLPTVSVGIAEPPAPVMPDSDYPEWVPE